MAHIPFKILERKALPQEIIVLELIRRIIAQTFARSAGDSLFADVNVEFPDFIQQKEPENCVSLDIFASVFVTGRPFAAARAHEIVEPGLLLRRDKVFTADGLAIERAEIDFAGPASTSAALFPG